MKHGNLIVKLVPAISYLLKSSPLRIVSPANEFTCCLFSLVDCNDLMMVTVVVIAMLIVLVIRLMKATVIVLTVGVGVGDGDGDGVGDGVGVGVGDGNLISSSAAASDDLVS